MEYAKFKKLKLPKNPGVYIFKQGKVILYIGKATSLAERVKSYFSKDLISTRGPIIEDMVRLADRIEFVETDSVLEALILEANLIKKYKPQYNSKEKDNKSFNYIAITNEKFPRVLIMRGRELRKLEEGRGIKAKYTFGPYPQAKLLLEALRIIRKIFPFLDKKTLQKDTYEFYKQLSLAPQIGNKNLKKEYAKNIRNIRLFLMGKKGALIKLLQKEMASYAKQMQFERAGQIRNQIFALEHIREVSLLKQNFDYVEKSDFRIEAYDIAHLQGRNSVGVMVVINNGDVDKNEYRKFKLKRENQINDIASLREILERRLAHTEWPLPRLIVADGGKAQKNALEKVLREQGIQIPVIAVVKNERHKPRAILGRGDLIKKYGQGIILANSEAHRFAIKYHRELESRIK